MEPDVRFDRMVPSDVVARREACNLAYLPLGEMEWHGPHMPFGTDYLIVAALAEEAARRFGGVVFPPLCYSDNRFYLHDCRREWRRSYARDMRVPEAFGAVFGLEHTECYGAPAEFPPDDGPPADEPLPLAYAEMERDFIRQIARTLLEIHLYGFARILLLPGHGPMPRACPKAEEIYRQNVRRRKALGSPAKTMTWMYSEAAKEAEPLLGKLWIHADKTESSLVMALCEGLMRLDLLPGDRRQIVAAYLGEPYITETQGYNPARKELWPAFDALDPRNADAEYGRRIVECVLNRMGRIVAEFVS